MTENDIVDNVIQENQKTAELYNPDDLTIATICSHSSLQLFNAAKNEGLKTLGVIRSRDKVVRDSYDAFPLARPDQFYEVEEYEDLLDRGPDFAERNSVFIPHGSSVEYLRNPVSDYHGLEVLPVPTYGNRKLIPWEFDRVKQRQWLEGMAGLKMPVEIKDPKDIKGPVIVKLEGAPGGRGSVIVRNIESYKRAMEELEGKNDYKGSTIQQFIPGTRYYAQFFPAPYMQHGTDLEFFGFDVRRESDIDESFKLGTPEELLKAGYPPTFNVTGNFPCVMRESTLMRDVIPAGRKTLDASKHIANEGLIGPYCLELVVDADGDVYCFEISARIVAGSNALANGSPYGLFTYKSDLGEVNYARRMMMDIKDGFKKQMVDKIIT